MSDTVKHGDVRTWKRMGVATVGTKPGASVGLALCKSTLRPTLLILERRTAP